MLQIWNRLTGFFLILFCASIFLSSCLSSKVKIEKTALPKYFEQNQVFRESHTGLIVYDVDEQKVVFDYNGHKHFTPASNTKLLTYLAALEMMPDSIPSLEYCLFNDSLYFSGLGDPTTLYPNFEYGVSLDFLQSHQKTLVYIPKAISDARFGPGWSWDDFPYYYSAEKSSFPIYGNMVYFRKSLNDDAVRITPDYFEQNVQVIQDSELKDYSIDRNEFENNFEIKLNDNVSELEDEVPFIYADSLFVRLLSDTLNKQITIAPSFPNCETRFLSSLPTDSVSKQILIDSDNFLAEHMLLMISAQLSDTLNSENVIQFMMENHLAVLKDEIHWVDGSGLSRYNQVTPHAMIEVLKAINNQVPQTKLYTLLPESALSGTLENSFKGLDGKVHAKTGSMSHVYNLSGFLETNSGKTLLFSFMNNNFNVSFSELKLEMERVLTAFVNK